MKTTDKVHIVNSTTYEEIVEGHRIQHIVDAFEDVPADKMREGMIWHVILGRAVPANWADKEMWVDRKDTILSDDSHR